MPRGANQKREREYKELKEKFEESGRYKGREEEVAARIVNKQRAELGETKEAKAKEKKGQSADTSLPIEGYDKMTVSQVASKLPSLSSGDIKKIRAYEQKHKNRKSLMDVLDRKSKSKAA